jgi:hypothetical protein
MENDTPTFEFPEMPDEAVIAVDRFLEAFYTQFQNRYFAQMHRYYYPEYLDFPGTRRYDDQLPLPLDDPPF